MALIKCEECGKEISDKATACPHCGVPKSTIKLSHEERERNEDQRELERINNLPEEEKIIALEEFKTKKENQELFKILSWVVIFSVICIFAFSSSSSETKNTSSEISSNESTSNNDTTTEAGYTSPECEAEWRNLEGDKAISEKCRDSASQNAGAWVREMTHH